MSDENLDTQVDEVVETPEAPTMDDTIRQTLAEIESREETEEQRADRQRDEKGRFAPKVEAAPETPPAESEPASPELAPVAAPVVPPELQRLGLRKEEAEAFALAPEAVKQAFIRRSEEMHRGIEQFREKAQLGAAMERAVSPYMATIQALGVTPDVAVQKLMAADHSLRYGTPQQKAAMVQQIARDYGVDLGQQPAPIEGQAVDPNYQALQTQIQQMGAWITQQNQAREWQERNALNSEIDKFASDPSHVHFATVRNDMAGLIQAGLATSLADAYEKAIYANPEVRAKVLAEQQAKAETERRAEAERKAAAAKAAAAVNVNRRGTLRPAKAVGSMDDTIRETAERLGLIS